MAPDGFREFLEKGDLFTQVIHNLPYPLAVFSPDGTLKAANPASIGELSAGEKRDAAREYNIFHVPDAGGEKGRTAAILLLLPPILD